MKPGLGDTGYLRSVRPSSVSSYLRSSGWRWGGGSGEGSLWTRLAGNEEIELVVPAEGSEDVRDFAARMAEVLETIAAVEGRSPAAVIDDLEVGASDVVRVVVEGDVCGDGTLPLDVGIRLLGLTRSLIAEGASIAARSRPEHTAEEYVRQLRIVPPTRGSFVVAVHCPVPPQLESPGDVAPSQFAEVEEEVFERKVTTTLVRSCARAQGMVRRATATRAVESALDAVRSGVTASVCETIASMLDAVTPAGVAIGFGWARTRRAPGGSPHRVGFSSEMAPWLTALAGVLRRGSGPLQAHDLGVEEPTEATHELIGRAGDALEALEALQLRHSRYCSVRIPGVAILVAEGGTVVYGAFRVKAPGAASVVLVGREAVRMFCLAFAQQAVGYRVRWMTERPQMTENMSMSMTEIILNAAQLQDEATKSLSRQE